MRKSVYYPHLGTLTLITEPECLYGRVIATRWWVRHGEAVVARGRAAGASEDDALAIAERFARHHANASVDR